jgi:hypothetical protein
MGEDEFRGQENFLAQDEGKLSTAAKLERRR